MTKQGYPPIEKDQMRGIETKLTTTEPTKRIYAVTVSTERLKLAEEKWFKLAKENAKIPGFRKGQIPEEIVLKQMKPWIEDKVTQELFPSVVDDIVKKGDLKLVYNPVVSNLKYQMGEKLTFEITFSVEPTVNLKNYKGLKLKRYRREVKEEEVERELRGLLNHESYLVPKADGKVDRDDLWAVLSARYIDARKPSEPLLEANQEIISLEEEVLPWGLREALGQAQVGSKSDVVVDCDADCPSPDLRGQKLKLEIDLHEVKELKQSLDQGDNVALDAAKIKELRDEIRKVMNDRYKTREDSLLHDQVIGELLDANPLEVPEIEVQQRAHDLIERAKTIFTMSNRDLTAPHEQELRVKYKIEALNDIRLGYIIRVIAKEAGLKIEEADIKKRLEGAKDDEERKKLINNKEALLYEILMDKALTYVAENAKTEIQQL